MIASEPRLLVPGHDAAVFERFPRVSERIGGSNESGSAPSGCTSAA